MIRFVEPVSALMECALAEFPSLSTKVVLVSGMATAEGAWGQTWWPDESGELHPEWEDGITALVLIDAGAPYHAIPDILAHELAHVVAGPDGGHGDVFADAYLRIHAAFCRAHGEEPTAEMLAELHELIECARTGRTFGTEPEPAPAMPGGQPIEMAPQDISYAGVSAAALLLKDAREYVACAPTCPGKGRDAELCECGAIAYLDRAEALVAALPADRLDSRLPSGDR